jgi:hypothetical protein
MLYTFFGKGEMDGNQVCAAADGIREQLKSKSAVGDADKTLKRVVSALEAWDTQLQDSFRPCWKSRESAKSVVTPALKIGSLELYPARHVDLGEAGINCQVISEDEVLQHYLGAGAGASPKSSHKNK